MYTHIHTRTHTRTRTHTMEYCSAMRKKEILPFATEGIMLNERSQTEKDKYLGI